MLLFPLFNPLAHAQDSVPKSRERGGNIYHILIRLLQLLKLKHLLIHYWFNLIRIDTLIHTLKLESTTHQHAPNRTDIIQTVQETWLILRRASQEPNDRDNALGFDGLERLLHSFGPADLENVVDAEMVGGEGFGCFAPVGVVFVIDDMVGAKFFEGVGFGR